MGIAISGNMRASMFVAALLSIATLVTIQAESPAPNSEFLEASSFSDNELAQATRLSTLENIRDLKAYSIAANRKARDMKGFDSMKKGALVDFISRYGNGLNKNIVHEYAQQVGTMKRIFRRGVNAYIVRNMDRAVVFGKGIIKMKNLGAGTVVFMDRKSVGLTEKPGYFDKLTVTSRDYLGVRMKVHDASVKADSKAASQYLIKAGKRMYKEYFKSIDRRNKHKYAVLWKKVTSGALSGQMRAWKRSKHLQPIIPGGILAAQKIVDRLWKQLKMPTDKKMRARAKKNAMRWMRRHKRSVSKVIEAIESWSALTKKQRKARRHRARKAREARRKARRARSEKDMKKGLRILSRRAALRRERTAKALAKALKRKEKKAKRKERSDKLKAIELAKKHRMEKAGKARRRAAEQAKKAAERAAKLAKAKAVAAERRAKLKKERGMKKKAREQAAKLAVVVRSLPRRRLLRSGGRRRATSARSVPIRPVPVSFLPRLRSVPRRRPRRRLRLLPGLVVLSASRRLSSVLSVRRRPLPASAVPRWLVSVRGRLWPVSREPSVLWLVSVGTRRRLLRCRPRSVALSARSVPIRPVPVSSSLRGRGKHLPRLGPVLSMRRRNPRLASVLSVRRRHSRVSTSRRLCVSVVLRPVLVSRRPSVMPRVSVLPRLRLVSSALRNPATRPRSARIRPSLRSASRSTVVSLLPSTVPRQRRTPSALPSARARRSAPSWSPARGRRRSVVSALPRPVPVSSTLSVRLLRSVPRRSAPLSSGSRSSMPRSVSVPIRLVSVSTRPSPVSVPLSTTGNVPTRLPNVAPRLVPVLSVMGSVHVSVQARRGLLSPALVNAPIRCVVSKTTSAVPAKRTPSSAGLANKATSALVSSAARSPPPRTVI